MKSFAVWEELTVEISMFPLTLTLKRSKFNRIVWNSCDLFIVVGSFNQVAAGGV